MKSRKTPAGNGFTLLEVLVSTVLLGTVFVAVVGLTSQSLRNIRRMPRQERAMVHARETMNEFLLLPELESATQSGHWDDGYQWQVNISPSDGDAELKGQAYGLFRIQVAIRWESDGKTKGYALETTDWARRANTHANR